MDAHEKILILGGTGHFGARIARRLAGMPGIELIVTSRDQFRAEVLVDELLIANPESSITALALNQESPDFEAELRAISPFVVVHTAGPYQGRDYRVARACIDAGSHYIDLADGREFVAGIGVLNEAAREADVIVISGASTLPGLSSSVVADLGSRFSAIETIEISIAPAQQTPRGAGTVAAVLSYCGRPFEALVDGRRETHYGWQELRRQEYPELGKRLSAACDVPDLELLPRMVAGVKTVTFHAALEAAWEHVILWAMAWLTRMNIVPDWSRFARTFSGISRRLARFGSDKGGMTVSIGGQGPDGEALRVDWQLTARDNHGPEIPCTPAILLVRKLLHDEFLGRGAVACMNLFTLDEFMNAIENYSITTALEEP
jgi:saccharopine dehydrogenase-like NADP-dependent oxidoreductase